VKHFRGEVGGKLSRRLKLGVLQEPVHLPRRVAPGEGKKG